MAFGTDGSVLEQAYLVPEGTDGCHGGILVIGGGIDDQGGRRACEIDGLFLYPR